MPRKLLFSNATLIGSFSSVAVTNSVAVHLKATVAVDGPDGSVRHGGLGPDCRRQREAHGSETAGVDPGVGLVELPVLRRVHLVLADAGGDDRALGSALVELLDAELRFELCPRFRWLVGHRELFLPARHLALPCRDVGLSRTALQHFLDLTDDLGDDVVGVADDRDVGASHFALFGRVDVDVDDLCVRRERVNLAGDAIVEARTERDEEVALLHRSDSGGVAVHARHTEAVRVIVGEGAAGHQCGHHVPIDQFNELAQCLCGAGP